MAIDSNVVHLEFNDYYLGFYDGIFNLSFQFNMQAHRQQGMAMRTVEQHRRSHEDHTYREYLQFNITLDVFDRQTFNET